MATGYRASSRVGNNTQQSSLALPAPTGTTVDDVTVVYFTFWRNSSQNFSSITGGNGTWNTAEGFPKTYSTGGSNQTIYVFWKRCTAADSGNYTITLSASAFCEADAVTISGIEPGVQVPVEATNYASASATTAYPSTSVTTISGDPALVWFGDSDAADADVPPTNFTEVQDASLLTSAAYRLPAASGTFTAPSATHGTSGACASTLVLVSNGLGAKLVRLPARPGRTWERRFHHVEYPTLFTFAAAGGDATFTSLAGDATAAGGDTTFTGDATFTTTVGDAPAAGGSSTLTGDATFTTTVGDAPAAGGSSTLTGDATFTTVAGDATAAGGDTTFDVPDATFATLAGDATADGGDTTFTGDVAPPPFDYGNGPGTWTPVKRPYELPQPVVDAQFATIVGALIAEGGITTFDAVTPPTLSAEVRNDNIHALLALLEQL
jgi:hypothetical protein